MTRILVLFSKVQKVDDFPKITYICAECEKEYEHDLYHVWCNKCGEKIEKGMVKRLGDDTQ